MATKYHISDNGMPGKCTASSPDSCPKTQAGDSFHGTLEEATAEAHARFEKELGAFATSSKAAEAKEAADAVKANGEEIYRHPQGKLIKIDADGNVRAFKDGKELSTSATAEKLRAGYGAWKRDDARAIELPEFANEGPRATVPAVDPQELQDSYARKLAEVRDAAADSADLYAQHRAYDAKYAEAEGRVDHYAKQPDGRWAYIKGKNPSGGHTRIVPSRDQKIERDEMNERLRAAAEAEKNAQTALEEAGLGHTIPDEKAVPGHSYKRGHTIRVNTQAQKWLLVNELQGQISDGKWENTPGNPWEDWTSAKVIVDPRNPGRNFFTTKDNYQLNAKDLLDVVGDRMIEDVRSQTGNANYGEKDMLKDLADLRKIFKTRRNRIEG